MYLLWPVNKPNKKFYLRHVLFKFILIITFVYSGHIRTKQNIKWTVMLSCLLKELYTVVKMWHQVIHSSADRLKSVASLYTQICIYIHIYICLCTHPWIALENIFIKIIKTRKKTLYVYSHSYVKSTKNSSEKIMK